MKGFKILGEKTLQMAHSHTAVSVPISAVPVPKVYCRFFRVGTGTSKCGTGTTLLLPLFSSLVPVQIFSGTSTNLQKFPEFSTFWISLYAHFFHCFIPPPN